MKYLIKQMDCFFLFRFSVNTPAKTLLLADLSCSFLYSYSFTIAYLNLLFFCQPIVTHKDKVYLPHLHPKAYLPNDTSLIILESEPDSFNAPAMSFKLDKILDLKDSS